MTTVSDVARRVAKENGLSSHKTNRFELLLLGAARNARFHLEHKRKPPTLEAVLSRFEKLREAIASLELSQDKKARTGAAPGPPDWAGERAGVIISAIKPFWITEAFQMIDRAQAIARAQIGKVRGESAITGALRLLLTELTMISSLVGIELTVKRNGRTGELSGTLVDLLRALDNAKDFPKLLPSDRSLARAIAETVTK